MSPTKFMLTDDSGWRLATPERPITQLEDWVIEPCEISLNSTEAGLEIEINHMAESVDHGYIMNPQ